MPSTQFLERIPYCPDCVMGVVTNVENYPNFVPGMSALRKTKDLPNGFEAEAVISFKGINERFASRVTIDEDARIVTVEKAERGGPVKALKNRWQFYKLQDGTTLVDFQVEVRLAFPLETLLRAKFDSAKHAIRTVFVEQAGKNCETIGEWNHDTLLADVSDLGLNAAHIYKPPTV